MVPTRFHAAIDWAAVLGVELLGHCPCFSPRVQALLRGSARFHAAYAAATDYELGAGPLPMPAHLAIDAAVGAGLIAAGAALRDEPAPVRAMLVGMGLTELLLVSMTEHAPRREHGAQA